MFYKLEKETQTEEFLTYNQMNIIISIQKLWFKLSYWIRIYIRASIFNDPDLKSVSNNLINFPSEANSFSSIFYGTEVAQNLKNLSWEFIKAVMNVVEPMKYGDNVLTNSRIIEWYKIADKISSYLASINVYWDENQWKYLLYQYIKIKTDGIYAIVKGNYSAEMDLYNQIENINFLMASYFARGTISFVTNNPLKNNLTK